MDHVAFMRRCLQLARCGAGAVAPNPMVGSVIVHDGKIIGEGFHQKVGDKHAEVSAIESVRPENKQLLPHSTLYVNLEPCSHHGRTPPCSTRIMEEGIPNVVVGAGDPSREVSGGGMALLQEAGVTVVAGIMEAECRALNKRFYGFHQKNRPFIVLKWAQSRDGFIGHAGRRIHISHALTNRLVHRWRSEEAAILAGINTVRIDDPQLTNRLYYGKSPLRLVIDKDLSISQQAHVLDGTVPSVVFNTKKDSREAGTTYVKVAFGGSFPVQVMEYLQDNEVQSVLVEGGAKTLQAFIDGGLWDEARVITNSKLQLNDGVKAPHLIGKLTGTMHLGPDEIAFFEPHE